MIGTQIQIVKMKTKQTKDANIIATGYNTKVIITPTIKNLKM